MSDATYQILGKYKGGEWEEVDETDNDRDATYMLGEYRLAFGAGWELKIAKPS